MYSKLSFLILFGMLSHVPFLSGQNLDSLKTAIFPDNGPAAFDASNFSFTDTYIPSNSFWASPFPESDVYHALLKYDHPSNPDQSYELRIGKGAQIYSFLTSSGETVPPQYPAKAPWIDEVWQMVAVDGTLNNPGANMPYFIHQAGVYLRTPEQTQPFYSPIVAEFYDASQNSYTVVNWGLQAHTDGNLLSGYTSSMMYYTQFKNLGNGIIQVDLLMYNFGDDSMNFINIPWGGVRRSTYDHWFVSNTDHTYQEYTGTFGAYTQSFTTNAGWAAFSSDALGNAPSMGLLMDNSEGTLRMGDAGNIDNRDYTVFEGIKFPNNLTPGKAVRARNFYILDSHIDSIKSIIVDEQLDNATFYGPWNKTATEVDSTAYLFEYQGNELIATETNFTDGLNLKLRPYEGSYPLFIIQSSSGEYRITSDLYTYSAFPYDGQLKNIQLLGYLDNKTIIGLDDILICSGGDYTFPDGSTSTNITSTTYHYSDVGLASNGYDSLVLSIVEVDPVNSLTANTSLNDGPGGVGSTNGVSSLALWLDGSNITGDESSPSNGSPISQWSDLSGNQNHYTSMAPNEPTFNMGTLPSLQFDASAANPQFLTGNQEKNLTYGSVFFTLNAIDNGNDNPLIINSDFSLKYEQTPNTGMIGYSDIGNSDYSSTLPSIFGIDNIISFQTDCASNTLGIHSNGNTTSLNIGSADNAIPLGELGNMSQQVSGNFYEIIAYQAPLNTAQKIIVDNYLSAKYGGLNIVTDLYDEDDIPNGNYDHDVAGIGRMDASNIHDNAKGTGIIQINNPQGLDDTEFLIWGSDNGATSFSEVTDIPSIIVSRMVKIWAVSEVDISSSPVDVGAVDLTFDLSELSIGDLENIALIIDSNGNGSFADETHIPNTSTHKDDYEGQADVLFQGIDLQDGDRFTLGLLPTDAPGGIYQDLGLWLSADKNISSDPSSQVNLWRDQSQENHLASGLGPDLSISNDKLINYNPVLSFNGMDDKFQISGGIVGTNTYSDFSIFIITRLNAAPHQSTIFRESVVGGGISSHLPWENGRVFWDAGISSGDGRINTLSGLSAGDDALWALTSHDGTSDFQSIRKNGQILNSDNTAISITGNNSNTTIASTGGGLYYEGDIAEIIAYLGNDQMSGTDLQKIETYLSIKYAYTLSNALGGTNGDYINSRNEVIWDADANPNYHNEIIAISRDDASSLEQKQSTNRDATHSIYIGNIANDNNQNTTSISNDVSSVVMGHDTGLLYDPNPGSVMERPAGIESRLEREWKITNTNFSDAYTIVIEWDELGSFDINDIRLLVDTDGDFSNASIYGSPDVTITEGSIIISGIGSSIIPMNQTRYITIGSINATTTPLLPIELLSFDAQLRNQDVLLEWVTVSEINNDYFTVERSKNGVDWEIIEIMDGAGTSEGLLKYSTWDYNPYGGISYYRLKQTDFDGSFTYSETIPIQIIRKETIGISPTPNDGSFNIMNTSSGSYQILDLNGKVLHEGNIESGSTSVDIKFLPNGIYFVRIYENGTHVHLEKFIKG